MTDFNIKIKVDPSDAQKGADKAKKAIEGVGTSADRVANAIKATFASLSFALLTQQIFQYADAYTTLQNRLRVTGAEQAALNRLTQQTFDIANRTRQPVEAIGNLYQKASISANELGASQADLAKFTETVGNALRIQGGSAAASSGALLQLGQALGAGIVRAEEFNSILEGAFPIAQAAAAGLDKAGGSVARLRQLIITGSVTSDEFFNAILSQSEELEKKLGSAVLTVGQALTVLNNNITQYVGQLATTSGLTTAVAQAIELLANNLDIAAAVAQTLASVIGVALAARALPLAIFAVNALTAAIAANPFGALAIGITTAISALAAFSDKIEGATSIVNDLTDTVLAVVDVTVAGFLTLVNSVSPFEISLEDVGDAFKFLGQVAQGVIRGIIALFDLVRASSKALEAAILDPFNAASAASAAFQANIGQTFNAFQKAFDTRQQQRAQDDLRKKVEEAQAALEAEAQAAEVASLKIDKNAVRQSNLLRSIIDPIEEARTKLSDLNALYAAGSLTVEQYEKAKKPLLNTINSTTSATAQNVATFQSEIDKLRESNALLQLNGLERESLSQIMSIQDALKRKLTESEKAQVIELTRSNEILQRQSDILESIKGPPQDARNSLEALNSLFASGKISVEEYNKSYNKFALDLANFDTSAAGGVEQYFRNLQETALTSADVMRGAFEAVGDSLSSSIEEFANTGKLNFKSFADDVLKQINRIASQALSQQILGAFGGGGGAGGLLGGLFGGGGGLLPGFADGGSFEVGGTGGVDNNVLSLNDRPIARVSKGETVSVDNGSSGQGRPVQVIMNIQTQDANSFRASQGQILARTSAALNRAQQRNR